MTLYLLNYNNYYNRQVKFEANVGGYAPYLAKFDGDDTDNYGNSNTPQLVNWNPRDSVDTTQIINWNGEAPNYVLVLDDANNIISRWFVTETMYIREGQIRLVLHRDLVVDYYNDIVNAPCFVEKATLNGDNDLIFNSENMTFNQIKQSETLIKDQSGCPWLCIYAASKNSDAYTTFSPSSLGTDIPLIRTFDSVTDFNNWNLKQAADANSVIVPGTCTISDMTMYGAYDTHSELLYYGYNVSATNASRTQYSAAGGISFVDMSKQFTATEIGNVFHPQWSNIESQLASINLPTGGVVNLSLYNDISDYNGQYVRVKQTDGSYRYYKISMSLSSTRKITNYAPTVNQVSMSTVWALTNSNIARTNNSAFTNMFRFTYSHGQRMVSYEDVTASIDILSANVGTNRYHLTDAPYDMFCMPYSDSVLIRNSAVSGFTGVTSSKSLAMLIAKSFIEQYSGDNGSVYDVQILPYCPLTSSTISVSSSGVVTLDINDSTGYDSVSKSASAYTPIMSQSGSIKGYLFHCTVSSFSRDIQLAKPIVINDYKVENECDVYRLVSPNYNGVFEFSAAMNGGVSVIHVQCTYKPFTPYIKLFPDWGRLYGNNFGEGNYDARGLICGGDFSLPMVSSAWATYERQNKNYQLSFDRQVQNMEVNHQYDKIENIVGAAGGALAGATTGATMGAMGGPLGMIAGGLGGGIASALGGVADIALSEKRYQEALDYTKDMFGYQLGNIKALPQSLSKVSAYNVDNKYFPFLEYYTCSEVEKQALRDKIKYNGMTVMAIGTMSQYMQEQPTYIKGKIIRLDNLKDDYHLAVAISDEINKGVYI